MKGFHIFLLLDKSMVQTTCTKHLKFVKAIMNFAVTKRYLVIRQAELLEVYEGLNFQLIGKHQKGAFQIKDITYKKTI